MHRFGHTLGHTWIVRVRWFGMLLGVLLVAGCNKPAPPSASTPSTGAPTKQQSEDSGHRFAVFSPAIGVMLRDLGFEDSIVGKHTYDSALSDSIPVVGSQNDIDYELLITLEPTDLFFERNTMGIPERVQALAKDHGWHLWTYKLETLDDIANAVDDLYLKLVGFPKKKVEDSNLLHPDLDPTKRFEVELPSARLANSWSPIGRAAKSAGRVLLLASVDPPGAMGPGSFHAQLLERLGITPAITSGGMWQELDYEDLIGLKPDSIIVFLPKKPDPNDLIGEPIPMDWDTIQAKVGGLAKLPIPAVEHQRIAIIEDPLGLFPSTSLGHVADEIKAAIERWSERKNAPAIAP